MEGHQQIKAVLSLKQINNMTFFRSKNGVGKLSCLFSNAFNVLPGVFECIFYKNAQKHV